MARTVAFLLGLLSFQCTHAANPIRRVVSMLQNMQQKITEEGKRDEEMFDRFSCYCKSGSGDLQKAIDAAETKSPQLLSAIKEAKARKEQLASDLEQHKADRASAKKAVDEATALRKKEAAAFSKESSDYKTNIAAIGKAVTALEKGATGFLQSGTANAIRSIALEMDLSAVDRDVLSSYLSGRQDYAPQSGQITGILKQMGDEMEKSLGDVTTTEESSKKTYDELVAAKSAEIQASTDAIEKKLQRHGELSVEIVNMEDDLDDTTKALEADKKFLADLESNCATKKQEYDVVKKTRADELVALADTIKILNDDDALELFKKALPSSSLLQTRLSSVEARTSAIRALSLNHGARVDLVALVLRSKSANFDKVVKMIEDMLILLGKEQSGDDDKVAYCETNFDKTEDEAKRLSRETADLEHAIEEGQNTIATLKDEIKSLVDGITALDKSVAEATETRKEEHKNYVDTIASDSAAKELLAIAKNRLNQFYNPKLFKAPPKRELSEQDRITVNLGGTLAPTAAPGGIAGTGITVFAEAAPPPPPAAVAAYSKKSEESTGVIAMLDLLVKDLDKEINEMGIEEKNSQAEYESFMQDSAKKRAADSTAVTDKEGAKADAEAALQKNSADKKSTVAEAMANAEEISALHGECDWLISNFDARKEARAGEVESLKNAKAVLAGADYSFVEIGAVRKH